MNINTKKYYDGLADLPTGGGVPEDRVEKAYQLLKDKAKESYLSHGSFSASPFGLDGIPHVKYDAISKLMVEFSDSELSVAAEKLKEQEREIERLKAENERLRGENDVIIARLKENMVRFYYFINNRFIPMLEKEHKYPVNFLRYGQYGERIPQVTIEEIVKEYFESITPSPTTKK